jgi:hypothetical protein
VTKDAVALATKEDWDVFCTHTETVEKQYWETDGIIPEVTDHTVTNLKPGCNRHTTVRIGTQTLRVTVTAVNLTLNAVTLCLMKTVTWSLQTQYS